MLPSESVANIETRTRRMAASLGRSYKIAVALAPAVFVFVLTLVISLVTGHPQGLFLTNSIRGIPLRFVMLTLILLAPILILPRLLTFALSFTTNRSVFGQRLVKASTGTDLELGKTVVWALRPVQGISLSLILAERFLSLLEFSIGVSYTRLLFLIGLFMIGGVFTSVFLSVIWAFDDLGVKIYNGKTEEVHTAGSSIGTFLPLITGAVGVAGLFHASLPMDALVDLLEIVMVLYPPYVFFAVFHNQLIIRRSLALSEKLRLKKVQTMVW